MALVAFLSATDLNALWMLASVTFVTGMGMAFYYPAYSAWLPALDPRVRPPGRQRLRGHGAPDHRAGHRPRVAGAVVGLGLAGGGVHGRRGVVGRSRWSS